MQSNISIAAFNILFAGIFTRTKHPRREFHASFYPVYIYGVRSRPFRCLCLSLSLYCMTIYFSPAFGGISPSPIKMYLMTSAVDILIVISFIRREDNALLQYTGSGSPVSLPLVSFFLTFLYWFWYVYYFHFICAGFWRRAAQKHACKRYAQLLFRSPRFISSKPPQ